MSIIQSIIGTNLTISGGGPPPYINVYGWSNPMNEGDTNTAYVQYENYPTTTIFWELDNFASASNDDWQGGVLPSGSFNISGTGTTSFNWTATADMITEGGEGYVLRVGTTFGGSDIVNQYLTISDTSTPPNANFTIEWWQKVENNGTNARPWSIGLYPTQTIALSYESMSADYYWINNSIVGNVSRNHLTGQWEHMAFVRNNGVVKGYINGVEYFSGNNNAEITDTINSLYVGTGEISAGTFRGYIKDLHVIKGYAKYTGNFTPPQVPIIPYAGSKLLLNVASDLNKFTDNINSTASTMTGTVTYSTDIPYTAAGPYTQFTNQWGTGGSGSFVLTFAGGTYNADLANVTPGWTVSVGGNPVATVSGTTGILNSGSGDYIQISLNVDLSGSVPGTFTFTQPALGGSLYFNGSSYLNYGSSTDWAMDV